MTWNFDEFQLRVLQLLECIVSIEVAAEIFGVPGVGQRMMQASSLLSTEIVLVYMLTMAGLYGLFDTVFVALQNWLLRWRA